MSVKLVLSYSGGDGCTYSCDVNLPFEYESAEAALVDFERLCVEAHNKQWPEEGTGVFVFCGTEFHSTTFHSHGLDRFYFPGIRTLDEWFESQKLN